MTGDSLRRLTVVEGVGVAVAGDPDSVERVHRQVEREVRSYGYDESEPMGVDRLARVAADAAGEAGVAAVVAARDDAGRPAVRAVTPEDGVLADRVVAFGTGAAVALGHLEGVPEGAGPDAAADAVREALARAADRDPDTGEAVDVWLLADDRE